jgi:hypothetical protein
MGIALLIVSCGYALCLYNQHKNHEDLKRCIKQISRK